MLRDEAILERSEHGHYRIIHNHNDRRTFARDQILPVFNTTKRLPGTTEYVAKIRPKVVKAVKA